MQDVDFVNGLLDFIAKSPTPFHAVETMTKMLDDHGFKCLDEKEKWSLSDRAYNAERYYVTRNNSSIIAFQLNQPLIESGIKIIGAHTDSPCLKVKPNPEIINNNYLQLGVEVYGGVLLNPWFDRDLSLAGRVSYLNENNEIDYQLIDFEKAIAVLPNLAIHLDRDANSKHSINKQKHLPPILMKLPETGVDTKVDFKAILLNLVNANLKQSNPEKIKASKVLDYELSFYDVQRPAVIGLHDDFISSARLDNLLSCYTGLRAMIDGENGQNTMLVCTDHEEVGSATAAGAGGTFLKSVLDRLCSNDEDVACTIAHSMMLSVDNAHGVHPNYADKHDGNHGPLLNNGPVIKTNANQRYATNSETSAHFMQLCEQADVPVQTFVVRSDMACGGTLGSIIATEIGVNTVDVGVPTFAMHSIRELAGRWDAFYLYRVLKQFYK